jgi:hypothetical protein
MFSKADEELTADQAKVRLGPPPLLPSESESEYWKWWEGFVQPDQPKTFPAWVEVNDQAELKWEQRRLRHASVAIIERAQITALAVLLYRYEQGVSSQIAQEYFGKEGPKQRRARDTVGSHGITQQQIEAHAMVNRGKQLLSIDRMHSNRAGAGRQLNKDIAKRAEIGGVEPKQSRERDSGAPGLAN